ncbi:MAG: enterobactin ABC transporter permease, partial [Actinobacteria bacterium]
VCIFFPTLSPFNPRLMDPNEFAVLQGRMFATFTAVEEPLLVTAAVAVLAVSVIGWRVLHTLDVLALGRETAISLGVDYRRTVTFILVLIAILVAVSTALVGPVLFFGLLVSNLAYRVMGTDRHRWTLPAAVFIAVIALVGGQTVLQHVFALNATLSIIIEFFGGLLFIALLLKGAKR